jgi:hypothetical protein
MGTGEANYFRYYKRLGIIAKLATSSRYCKRIFPARLPALQGPGVCGMTTRAILSSRLGARAP